MAITCGFVMEQYYRLQVCNLSARDNTAHSYNIYPGATIDSVMDMLRQDYEIGNMHDFDLHARYMLFNYPEPGHYVFPSHIGNRELINTLKYGLQTPMKITWNSTIRTREELAEQLSSRLLMDYEDILERLDSDDYMEQFGMDKETSRCLFIPNTYEVYWTITPDQLFERMAKEYETFWSNRRRRKAESIHLTPVEVDIVASIVESETYRKSDFPLIASLYLNRIRKGMPLQACPTIKYALGDFQLKRILYRHLNVDSPYNTYKNAGLPPGPIRCASPEAIDAVLNAPKTDYLYMCANPKLDGTHIFSATYSGHSSAAADYHHMMDSQN